MNWRFPVLHKDALLVWLRNVRVWRKLIIASILMNIGEPFLYLLGLGFGLGLFVGEMSGMPYITFLASGILASSAMNTASFEGMYSVYTRMEPQKTYESILATPIELDSIIAGEMLWCATKATISGTAILAVAFILGGFDTALAVLAIPVTFLIGLCFAGPAIVMASFSPGYDFFNYYVTLIVTPMFILCGVFYPITTLPEALQGVVQILPLTHGVDLIRSLVTGELIGNPLLHILVLGVYAVVGFYFAAVFSRRRLLN